MKKQFSFLNSYFVFQKQNIYVNEDEIESEFTHNNLYKQIKQIKVIY